MCENNQYLDVELQLIQEVTNLLGFGTVQLEVSDQDIINFSKIALRKIAPHLSEREFRTLTVAPVIELEGVVDVLRVYSSTNSAVRGSAGYKASEFEMRVISGNTNNFSGFLLQNQFNSTLNSVVLRDFKFIDGKLYLDDFDGTVVAECILLPTLESLKDESAKSWIFDYTLALCKERIGRIRSKYSIDSSPVKMDGQSILQEGLSEKRQLEQDIISKGYGLYLVTR